MKLLFYINSLVHGGAERVMSQLANQFAEKGFATVFVTSFKEKNEYPLDSRVKRISIENEQIIQSKIMRNYTRIKKLRCIIKQEKPDVVISFMQEPNFRSILATCGMPIKNVVSVRNTPETEYAGIVGKIVGKIILPFADGCVFQTEEAKLWFPKRLQKKSKIIYNAVEKSFFQQKYEPQNDIIAIGRLSDQKNHKMLIQAFSKIAAKYPNVALKIFGQGPLRQELNQLIEQLDLKERVFLMGVTSNVPQQLSKAKLFVLSSNYEGMPNCLMEAMAVGVPCISTDCPCGGPRMLLQHEISGLLVPIEDQNALAEAMDRILGDINLAEKLSKQAKKRAEDFMPDQVFEQWKQYIESICKENYASWMQ